MSSCESGCCDSERCNSRPSCNSVGNSEHDHGHDHGRQHQSHPIADNDLGMNPLHGGCCGSSRDHIHGHDHDHDHGHNQQRQQIADLIDDCGDCCGGAHNHGHGHGQDHGHGHNHDIHSDCGDSCGHSQSRLLSTTSTTANGSTSIVTKHGTLATIQDLESQLPLNTKCAHCDPTSSLPHTIIVTRFRVANLCCAGEERLIRQALKDMVGVEDIGVNIIGRMAIVRHCAATCCAPANTICEVLNKLHLGVSIQESGTNSAEVPDESCWQSTQTWHTLTVFILYVVGLLLLAGSDTAQEASYWLFFADTILGLLPILHSAYISLIIRHMVDIHLLITVAAVGALAAQDAMDSCLLVVLFLASEVLEHELMRRLQREVDFSQLSALPKEVLLAKENKTVPLESLKLGDIVALRMGDMVPCDGKVVRGEAVVSEANITGEAKPINKKRDNRVISGSAIQNGYIEVEVDVDPAQSTWRQLQQAVEDVQADRGYYASLLDSFAMVWTPLVVAATVIVILIGGGVTNDWMLFVHRGLVLLVLACPCAVVVSAPVPSVCALASAARQGVLIRGSSALERLADVDTVAVDKTGTLTKGFFAVHEQLRLAGHADLPLDALYLAAALESRSTHPLATAIVAAQCGCLAEASNVQFPAVRQLKNMEGIGLEGWVEIPEESDWRHVAVGNDRLLRSQGGKVSLSRSEEVQFQAFLDRNKGCTIVLVVVDDAPCLLLSLADEVRPDSRTCVQSLHGLGIHVEMLTGDHEDVALAVAGALEIPKQHVHARLFPRDKAQWVQNVQQRVTKKSRGMGETEAQDDTTKQHSVITAGTRRVAMVGDGVNDSVALAAASVGCAMGAAGSAMVVQGADVVLLNDEVSLLPPVISLARKTTRIIMENCFFAVAVKVVASVLAVIGMLRLWQAILIDIVCLVVVVLNGLRVSGFRGLGQNTQRPQSTHGTEQGSSVELTSLSAAAEV